MFFELCEGFLTLISVAKEIGSRRLNQPLEDRLCDEATRIVVIMLNRFEYLSDVFKAPPHRPSKDGNLNRWLLERYEEDEKVAQARTRLGLPNKKGRLRRSLDYAQTKVSAEKSPRR